MGQKHTTRPAGTRKGPQARQLELSMADFRVFNHMSERMEHVHNEFRSMWTQLKTTCSSPTSTQQHSPTTTNSSSTNTLLPRHSIVPRNQANKAEEKGDNDDDEEEPLTDEELISLGLRFCTSLSTHHSIEERFFFPLLASRMPEFAPGGSLTAQHEEIHEGLVRMKGYLRRCELGEEQFQKVVLRGLMVGDAGADAGADADGNRKKVKGGGFEEVLWGHLDEEVRVLGGENMARFWTLDEVRQLFR
ncbi:hypothetical protein BJY01DRAFT_226442 [Aspergillus pseudoustus]|uniref:Hemerythrin-like domain-containing protein n=1 Tax=Aspergillus pseudoustus TaxID=1810923 RepID=A0ABR4IV78_9EURO